ANDGAGAHPNSTDEQVVSVEATNYMQLLNVTGVFNFQLPEGEIGLGSIKGDKSFDISPVGSAGGRGGFGGALFLMFLDNTTTAKVEDGAAVFSGDDGGFNMKAQEAIMNFNFSQSGGKSGEYGVSGTVAYLQQDSDTLAQLGDDVPVTGRNAVVYASSLETHINWVGSVALGGNLGLGISAGINNIDRDTRAVIGDKDPDAALPVAVGNAAIDVSERVHVYAETDGELWAFTVAAAIASAEKEGQDQQPAGDDALDGDRYDASSIAILLGEADPDPAPEDKATTGVGIAGAASVNLVKDTTQASIADPGTIDAGSLWLTTRSDTEVIAATGALAFAKSEGENAVGLAGAFSLNILDAPTRSYISGAKVTLSGEGEKTAYIDADRGASIFALAAGAGGAVAGVGGEGDGGGSGSGNTTAVSVAGSVSINLIDNDTSARLRNATLDLDSGSASVTATDHSDILAIGGGLALSVARGESGNATAAAFGVAVSVNDITSDVEASLTDSSITTTGDGTIVVDATNDASIQAYTLGASLSVSQSDKGGALSVAGAGSISVNLLDLSTAAAATRSTLDAEGGNVTIDADNTAEITGDAGGFALAASGSTSGSATSVAVGASVVSNVIDSEVFATIDDSTVDTTGGIALTAISSSTISALTLGGAVAASASSSGSAGAGALAGAGSLNLIRSETRARVRNDSSVTAGNEGFLLEARDESTVTADAGGLAIAVGLTGNALAGSVSVGAAFAINLLGTGDDPNAVEASIESSTVSGGSVSVLAASDATIDALGLVGSVAAAASSSAAFAGSFAGSVTINQIYGKTVAEIRKSDAAGAVAPQVTAGGGGLAVDAEDTSSINS
ncbi:MAG: hypothetical protein ACM3MM_03820, partial [Acidobacteriota bacterium]